MCWSWIYGLGDPLLNLPLICVPDIWTCKLHLPGSSVSWSPAGRSLANGWYGWEIKRQREQRGWVFLLLFWAEWKKQQGDPALWPQEDHWPIYEEIHLIWLHTSLTSVKGGGVLGLVFAFWFFCKETLHVNAKEALSFKAVALTS